MKEKNRKQGQNRPWSNHPTLHHSFDYLFACLFVCSTVWIGYHRHFIPCLRFDISRMSGCSALWCGHHHHLLALQIGQCQARVRTRTRRTFAMGLDRGCRHTLCCSRDPGGLRGIWTSRSTRAEAGKSVNTI